MKAVPMEHGAEYIVREGENDRFDIDYISGVLDICGYKIESEYIQSVEMFSIAFEEKIRVSRGFFKDKYETECKLLDVVAVKQKRYRREKWLFIFNSKELFISMMEEFSRAFGNGSMGRKNSVVRTFAEEAVKNYDGKRDLLTYIANKFKNNFYMGRDEDLFPSIDDEENAKRTLKNQINLPYDIMNKWLDAKCIVIDVDHIYELYKGICSIKPDRIDLIRGELLKEKEADRIACEKAKIISEYGENFENKDAVIKEYLLSADMMNISTMALNLKGETEFWQKQLEEKPEDIWAKSYIDILSEKMKFLEYRYYDIANSELEDRLGTVEEKKDELLEQIRQIKNGDFRDGHELYESCHAEYKKMKNQLSKAPFKGKALLLPHYMDIYRHGGILMCDQLNQRSPIKKKQLSKSEVNQALMYFYDASTPEKAEMLKRRAEYLENKKKGQPGEEKVDYALKWLDKSYKLVPKKNSKKYDQKSIVIYNPEFIDESQEYDHIVIGKQGIFVIETKNYAGKLIVDKNGNWIRVRKDGEQRGEKNPIQQVRQHEKLLKSLLDDDTPIINIICMAHPEVIIEGVENCDVPIVRSDLLTEFIEKYEPKGKALSEEKMEECLKRIEEHMV
ncbi:hypothetical protein IMSAG049_00600 [Clostridiales bacterium]|nr:hypothetical protein IMSAG049_00600 [Clostridiales bacterium]